MTVIDLSKNTWLPVLASTLIEIFEASDRAAVIVAVALIDTELTRIIKSKLLPPAKSRDSLFDHDDRPLQPLSAKINLAERLGLITPGVARLLHRVRDIRNDFAHRIIVQESIFDKCNNIVKDSFFIKGNIKDLQIELAGTYYSENSPIQHLLEQNLGRPTFLLRIVLIMILADLTGWISGLPGGISINVHLEDTHLRITLNKTS